MNGFILSSGTERSALFVALCVLIAQLRAERRVDVSAVARKVRSQRDKTIDTFVSIAIFIIRFTERCVPGS